MRHSRSSMPNVAKKAPVTTNMQVAEQAVRADRGQRLAADHGKPGDDGQRAENAGGGERLPQHERRQQKAEQRGAGRLDHAGVAERHQQEAGIADDGNAGAAKIASTMPRPPADAVEVADAAAQEQRQQEQAAPDAAVEGDVGRREADVDAVARGGEADRPEDRRAGAAQNAEGGELVLAGRFAAPDDPYAPRCAGASALLSWLSRASATAAGMLRIGLKL